MPYGTARPNASAGKSWTFTASAARFQARPAFLKLPTSSFFLLSTLTCGNPAAVNVARWRAMYWNCVSRSGWVARPSTCLALACRPNPRSCNKRRTVGGLA